MKKNFAILLGNFLEFYDFTLFAYLLPIIAPLLFPSQEIIKSYMYGYIFLAIGFLARPAGAVLFGYIGDRYSRKTAMITAILMMSISTITMSFLPINNTLPYIVFSALTVCRILQGLSAGGEYCGAGLMLIENSNKENLYLNSSILTSSALLGAFAASIMAAIITLKIFPKESWRFLFFIGGIIGFIALWLRLSLKNNIKQKTSLNKSNWGLLFKEYKLPLLYTIIFGALMNVPFQITTGFANTYFIATEKYDRPSLMLINAFLILFCAIITLSFGFISRIFNPLKMMLFASLSMTLFSFPFFFLLESKSFILFVTAELLLMLMSQFFVAPAFTVIAKLFPYSIRYRGVAMGNCLGLAFLGGSTPYISSYLIQHTNITWSPAIYLFFISFIGFIATLLVRAKLNDSYLLALDEYTCNVKAH